MRRWWISATASASDRTTGCAANTLAPRKSAELNLEIIQE
jgi:hypothetical protein